MSGPLEFHYRIFLREEFHSRRERNSRYSLRAFARDLGVDASALSRILLGRQAPSISAATALARRLRLRAQQKESFLASVREEKVVRTLARLPDSPWESLSQDQKKFDWDRCVKGEVGWYYQAIFYLLAVENFRQDEDWIARSLRISTAKVRKALRALREWGLIREENGAWRPIASTLNPPESVRGRPKDRRFQSFMLGRARRSLLGRERGAFARGTMFTIEEKYLPQVQQMAQEFLMQLRAYGESVPRRRLLHCVIGVFPLQADE